jgi:hypothetical protein
MVTVWACRALASKCRPWFVGFVLCRPECVMPFGRHTFVSATASPKNSRLATYGLTSLVETR